MTQDQASVTREDCENIVKLADAALAKYGTDIHAPDIRYDLAKAYIALLADKERLLAKNEELRDLLRTAMPTFAAKADEVSFADCQNPECPVECPDSHCLDYEAGFSAESDDAARGVELASAEEGE